MHRALTILLHVRNAQSTLADTAEQVLDMAAEVSERFEVLIIDDASTDATIEVARELCRRYPQVRLVRHRKPVGAEAAVRLASAQIRGEVLCARGDRRPTLQPAFAKARPARPNYLGRVRSFTSEDW